MMSFNVPVVSSDLVCVECILRQIQILAQSSPNRLDQGIPCLMPYSRKKLDVQGLPVKRLYRTLDKKLWDSCQETIGLLSRYYRVLVNKL